MVDVHGGAERLLQRVEDGHRTLRHHLTASPTLDGRVRGVRPEHGEPSYDPPSNGKTPSLLARTTAAAAASRKSWGSCPTSGLGEGHSAGS